MNKIEWPFTGRIGIADYNWYANWGANLSGLAGQPQEKGLRRADKETSACFLKLVLLDKDGDPIPHGFFLQQPAVQQLQDVLHESRFQLPGHLGQNLRRGSLPKDRFMPGM